MARSSPGYSVLQTVIVLLIATVLPSIARADVLTIGVHPREPAPQWANILATLAVDSNPVAMRDFADEAQMITELQRGTLDAAVISAPAAPLEGVRLIADLYPSVLHILHRDHLSGKSLPVLLTSGAIWAGGAGSAGERLLQNLMADYALAPDRVQVLADPITITPDIWFVFGGILNRDALSRLQGYRLYPFGASADATATDIASGMALRHPTLHTITLPGGLYPILDSRRVTTVAVNDQLVVRAQLATKDAYALAELVDQARPVLASRYPLVGLERSTDRGLVAHALALHEGATRYAQRDEPSFLERYAEVFAFLLTVLAAIGSAAVALNRYRQQRRKDRLDRFFERLLEQRAAVGQTDQSVVYANVRALQTEVVALVIEERINADGALLAFLALSNQLLAESTAGAIPVEA